MGCLLTRCTNIFEIRKLFLLNICVEIRGLDRFDRLFDPEEFGVLEKYSPLWKVLRCATEGHFEEISMKRKLQIDFIIDRLAFQRQRLRDAATKHWMVTVPKIKDHHLMTNHLSMTRTLCVTVLIRPPTDSISIMKAAFRHGRLIGQQIHTKQLFLLLKRLVSVVQSVDMLALNK